MKRSLSLISILILFLCNAQAQVTYEIKKPGINSKEYNEFAAVPYKDGVAFCSNRPVKLLVTYSDQQNNPLTDIYFAQKYKGSWGRAERLSPMLTTIFNDGPVTFSAAGTKVYFTRNINISTKGGSTRNVLGIYTADFIDGEWMNILPFEYNSDTYATGHPSLDAQGNKLYFISDMSGGYGGTDIYVSELVNGKWQKPVNLGADVNTSANEMFPYISSSGDLYFSSVVKEGNGGMDVLVTRQADGKWSKPKPLPPPINSKYDDFSYVCDASGKQGYFSSNRDGSDDIFEFALPIPMFEKCDSLKKNNPCFVFFQDGVAIEDSLPLTYEWDLGDGTKIKGLEAEHCYKADGTYSIKLNVIDTTTGEIFYNEAAYDLEVKSNEQVYIASADTAAAGQPISFDGKRTNLRDFKIDAWYWNFGDASADTGIAASHTFAKPGTYEVRLGVTTADDKKACSYKRIVVRDEQAGNPSTASGKVEASQVVLPPNKPLEQVYKVEVVNSKERIPLEDKRFDKLDDTYSVQENFVIDKQEYSYTVGQENTLSATWPIYKDVRSKGYTEAKVKSYTEDIVSLDEVSKLSGKEMSNKIVRIDNALFDPGKYDLTEGAKVEMDKLYRLMNGNSSISVNINAHTDNEGNEQANLLLSEKRAQAIMDYLASKGIEKNRMIPKGYGESEPVADNGTAEGRKLNRRVEIKINWR
jgi:outer membrane protein OmpA-like peptidoglycan-associated protein/chitodextrinase